MLYIDIAVYIPLVEPIYIYMYVYTLVEPYNRGRFKRQRHPGNANTYTTHLENLNKRFFQSCAEPKSISSSYGATREFLGAARELF